MGSDALSKLTIETLLKLTIALARNGSWTTGPVRGDLVFERTAMSRDDPDAIGWLLGHGEAPLEPGVDGPTRDVWDVLPLNPAAKLTYGRQRWENAMFCAIPRRVVERVGLRCPFDPEGLVAGDYVWVSYREHSIPERSKGVIVKMTEAMVTVELDPPGHESGTVVCVPLADVEKVT